MQCPHLFSLPMCKGHKEVEAKDCQEPPTQQANKAGASGLSGSIGLSHPWIDGSDDRFITRKRHKCATVFVDQCSGHGFIHPQKEASAQETLEAKKAFERYANSMGVPVKAYHADNGIFKAKAWVEACFHKEQTLTFAGVGAHHTNGKAERRIREPQEMARTALIHANKRWPQAIEAYLWPYAVRYANDCINNTPNMQDQKRRTPFQLFSGSDVEVNSKHWKPFGAPVYVLKAEPRDGRPHHKWASKSTMGIYLGRSPLHSKEVALVLDRTTGYVSPQFHVKVDAGFYTLRQETVPTTWQLATGFKEAKQPPKSSGQKNSKRPLKRKGQSQDSEGEGNLTPTTMPAREGNPMQDQQLPQPEPMQEDSIEPDESLATTAQMGQQHPTDEAPTIHLSGLALGTPATEEEPSGLRRSKRVRKPIK